MKRILNGKSLLSLLIALTMIAGMIPFGYSTFATSPAQGNDDCITLSSADPFTLRTDSGWPVWPGAMYWSTDKQSWEGWDGEKISAQEESESGTYVLYIRGNSDNSYVSREGRWVPESESVGDEIILPVISCTGNIETLRGAVGNQPSPTQMANGCYSGMFSEWQLTSAPSLPATSLSSNCYEGMFSACGLLTDAPELPASVLYGYCYKNMFEGCGSLINAPSLPATRLAPGCYEGMFKNCESLTDAPELPASVLNASCYYEMFAGCSSLINPPELKATELALSCYNGMFKQCSLLSVTEANTDDDPLWVIPSMNFDCVGGMIDDTAIEGTVSKGKNYVAGTPYQVSVVAGENGTVSISGSKTEFIPGQCVQIISTPASGFLARVSVFKTGAPDVIVPVTAGKFTMPKYPVTVSVEFGRDISLCNVSGYGTVEYTGTAITFDNIVVSDGDKELVLGTDFSVLYSDNVVPGTAKITITGHGDYAGSKNVNFIISKASISPEVSISGWVVGTQPNVPSVSGNPGNGAVSYKYKLKTADDSEYTDTVPNSSGTYTVMATVAETDYYSGNSCTKDFTISDHTHDWTFSASSSVLTATCAGEGTCPVEGRSVSIEILPPSDLVYDGTSKSVIMDTSAWSAAGLAVPDVVYSKKQLPQNEFVLLYSAPINAGVYRAGITATDNSDKTATLDFTVASKPLVSSMMLDIPPQSFSGDEIIPSITVKDGNQILIKDTDYTVMCTDNKIVGTATVTVTGTGNYKGTVEKEFLITPTQSSVTEAPTACDPTYNGNTLALVTVGQASGGTMKYSTDGSSWATEVPTATEAGQYTVYYKVFGDTNHTDTDTSSVPVTVKQQEIKVSGITADNKTYDGSITAELNLSGIVLEGKVDGDDLSVTATGSFGNADAGTGKTVTISGISLTGNDASNYVLAENGQQVSATAEISAKSLNDGSVTVSPEQIPNQTFSGNAFIPSVTVKDGTKLLVKGTDYTVTYKDNTDAGLATVTVTGIGNYTGSVNRTFTITTAQSSVTVAPTANDPTYNGNALALVTVGQASGGTMKYSTDGSSWATEVPTATEAGQYTVYYKVFGDTNHTDTDTAYVSVTVKQQEIKVSGITADNKTYDGSITAELNLSGIVLEGKVDGDDLSVTAKGSFGNADAGTGKTVTISGIALSGEDASNYILAKEEQQKSATADIMAKSLKDGSVTVSPEQIPNQTFSGNAITPSVTVTDGTKTLVLNTDYTVSYKDNTGAGTATVTVTGIGNYTGSVNRTFTITPTQSSVTVAPTACDPTYNGNALALVTVGQASGGTMKYSTDGSSWTTDVPTAKAAGQYTVYYKVFGDTNHSDTDTASVSVTVKQQEIKVSGITVENKTYDGSSAAELNLSGLVLEGKVDGDDLSVTATGSFGNANAGTGKTVTISGISLTGKDADNYVLAKDGQQGSATAEISAKSLKDGSVTVSPEQIPNQTFSGNAITPSVTVKDGTKFLVENTDYTVSYKDNTDAGLATVTVTGNGNYTGSVNRTFTITTTQSSVTVAPTACDPTYNGNAQALVTEGEASGGTLNYSTDGSKWTTAVPTATAAGQYTVYYKVAGDSNHSDTDPASVSVTIKQKEIVISGITAESRTYDKTTDVTLKFNNVVYKGIVSSDTLMVSAKGSFLTPDSEKKKTVEIYDLALVQQSENYVLAAEGQQTNTTADILPKQLTDDGMSIGPSPIPNQDFSGERLTPELKVKDGNSNLVKDKDYTLTYENNLNAGQASISVKGIGNYAGTEIRYFLINKSAASLTIVPSSKDNLTYNGNDLDLVNEGMASGGSLNYSTDGSKWTTAVPTATAAGQYTVYYKVVGDSNHSDTDPASVSVTVKQMEITVSNIRAEGKIYDGNVSATLDYSEVVLSGKVENDDLAVTAKGSFKTANCGVGKTVTITDISLTGTDSANYVLAAEGQQTSAKSGITPKSIEDGSVTVSPDKIANQSYTGSYITPSVTVTDGNNILEENIDYTVSYENNKDSGTATVTVTGTGNYEGSVEKNFVITSAQSSVTKAPSVKDLTYNGNAQALVTEGEASGGILNYSTDGSKWTTAVPTATAAGQYTVYYKVAGDSNHSDTDPASVSVTVKQIEITVSNIRAEGKIYDGSVSATLDYSEVVMSGKVENDDLSVTAKGSFKTANCGVGKTVTITDISLTGTDSSNYVLAAEGQQTSAKSGITPKSIEDGSVTVSPDNIPKQSYTGSYITPSVTVTDGNIILEENIDYSVSYENNKDSGTATVTVTGSGNYEGSVEKNFVITSAQASVTEAPSANELTYNGNEQALVSEGEASGGTMNYSTDGSKWTTAVPTATAAGQYTVYYKVVGDSNHSDTDPETVSVTVARKDIRLGTASLVSDSMEYNGKSQIPVLSITDIAKLTEGTDFKIISSGETDVGQYVLEYEGIGNYTNSGSINWQIVHTTHKYTVGWSRNDSYHWHSCTSGKDCSVTSGKEMHSDSDHDGICDVCGYFSLAVVHSYSTDWHSDDLTHWKECTCSAKDQESPHADNDHDGICDICKRSGLQVKHEFSKDWSYDGSHHWHDCIATGVTCDAKDAYDTHVDQNLDDKCDVCGCELPHSHVYSDWKWNSDSHWKECRCGIISGTGKHSDANKDGSCDVCGMKMSVTSSGNNPQSSGPSSGISGKRTRSADSNGYVSFGSDSSYVTGVKLPANSTGTITLETPSNVAGPEGCRQLSIFELTASNPDISGNAVIFFEIPVSVIESAGYAPSDVILYHKNATGEWIKLLTTYSVKGGKVYYQASTTAFAGEYAVAFYLEYTEDMEIAYVLESTGPFSFVCNGDIDKVDHIELDKKTISNGFRIYRGSTIVEFEDEFIISLSSGVHCIQIFYVDGVSNPMYFTSDPLNSEKISVPDTYDWTYHVPNVVMALIFVISSAFIVCINKRKHF